jgi:hypothetical protein
MASTRTELITDLSFAAATLKRGGRIYGLEELHKELQQLSPLDEHSLAALARTLRQPLAVADRVVCAHGA